MNTNRRSFFASAVAVVLTMFGIGKTKAMFTPEMGEPRSFGQFKEVIQTFARANVWKVSFADVHCGACTCPEGTHSNPEMEGFNAVIRTPKHDYRIRVQADYLGCDLTSREPEGRMSDLTDGKRTATTWFKIAADILRVETTGSKYATT